MQSARFDERDGLLRTLRPMDSHGSFQRAIMGLREERRRLEQPIDEMFDQLKERLGRLPTAEQRRVAEARP
jgi:hypothetical protein